jgi:predicted lipoprotein with Yx(FWY)xxD motif
MALAVAGCGSSSNSSGEAGYGSGSESTAASKPASSEPAATIAVANVGGGVGKVLVDSKGFTLYYFKKDKGGKSACYGGCASVWPPLTTGGAPQGMSGVEASKLGTTKRSDGTVEVTYAGWPLYTYEADKKPGEANGTDVKSFGASWYPLHPNGEKAGE